MLRGVPAINMWCEELVGQPASGEGESVAVLGSPAWLPATPAARRESKKVLSKLAG